MSRTINRFMFQILGMVACVITLFGVHGVSAAPAVARAVLFYSPTCPHCHYVMDTVLPPLYKQYGEQLRIINVDVTTTDGQALYQTAIKTFALPDERIGVPALVFGTTVLVGSGEIPAQLPGLITAALAAGGNDWPVIAGIDPWLTNPAALAPEATVSPFQRDPVANTLALAILMFMVISAGYIAFTVRPPFERPRPSWHTWAIPLLLLLGMAVAAYLSFVEATGSDAVCGPVGDCNTVQQSPYARLFGLLPVGNLGLIGYVAMLGAWATLRFGSGKATYWAAIALPAMAFGGTLFSIYLTFLEPFVIGASCIWCLTSAIIMTVLLWLTAPRGRVAPQRGRVQRSPAH